MPDIDINDIEYPFNTSNSSVDEEFDDMLTFGLHDEHSVRQIMDLPPHALEDRYAL